MLRNSSETHQVGMYFLLN